VISARQPANSQTPLRKSSEQVQIRLAGRLDFGASKSMVLSFLLHVILGVGLFAFDGLASKPWRQLGASSSAPSLIEVEMLASQMNSKKSAPIKSRREKVEPGAVIVSEKNIIQQLESDSAQSKTSASDLTGVGAANSDSSSSVSSAPSKLADAEMVYLNDLRQLLESKKEYPIAARRMGHRGRVVVRFVLERDGRVRKAEIVQGSQSEILNRAARGLIGRLHDVKPFPKEVALTEWAVVVPIEYQL
jgi:TonB family protein